MEHAPSSESGLGLFVAGGVWVEVVVAPALSRLLVCGLLGTAA